jgi:hypothetical protein
MELLQEDHIGSAQVLGGGGVQVRSGQTAEVVFPEDVGRNDRRGGRISFAFRFAFG